MRAPIFLSVLLFACIAERTLDITPLSAVNETARGIIVGVGLATFIIMDIIELFKKGGAK